jgi:hypothetical protein
MMVIQETIAQKWCPFIEDEIEIIEHRAYPHNDFLRQSGETFRVNGRQCTASIRCNMAGIPCSWAGTNPDCDRFDIFA